MAAIVFFFFFVLYSCASRHTVHFLSRMTIMQPQTETNLVKYCRQHHAVRSCSNHSVRFKNSNFTENIHHYCGTLSALKRLEMLKTRRQKTRCNDLNCSHTERPVEATCHNELCCYLHSFALCRTGILGCYLMKRLKF